MLEVGGLYSISGLPSVDAASCPPSNEDVLVAFSSGDVAVNSDFFNPSHVFFDVVNLNPSYRIQAE